VARAGTRPDRSVRPWRRLLLVFGAIGATVLSTAAFGETVSAQQDGPVVSARVLDQQRTPEGKPDNKPVEGVEIVIVGADDVEIGRGTTDEAGTVRFVVPARGEYVVRLQEDTLPEGSVIAANSSAEQRITRESFTTDTKSVNFFTGASQSVKQSGFARVAQLALNGVRLGLILAMCSVGLSLIFGTTGLTNFAHGEMVTFGGMMAYLFNVTGLGFLSFLSFLPLIDDRGRFQIFLAAPIAIVLGGLFGVLLDWGIFRRLRKRGIGLITQLVVTVGLSIMLRNMFLFQFGGRTKPLRDYTLQPDPIRIGSVTITPRDLVITILSFVVLVVVALALQRTRLGKATRAVSDNSELASSTGIDSQKVIRLVWFLGGGLAALGGVFRGMTEQVGFEMGSNLLFLMFAGITLGGLGSAFGALLGGFLVGLFVELATLVVPTELKNTPALIVLILVLLLRPQGILGKAQRVG
jgi:neutral amino acid transport system permease protein